MMRTINGAPVKRPELGIGFKSVLTILGMASIALSFALLIFWVIPSLLSVTRSMERI